MKAQFREEEDMTPRRNQEIGTKSEVRDGGGGSRGGKGGRG